MGTGSPLLSGTPKPAESPSCLPLWGLSLWPLPLLSHCPISGRPPGLLQPALSLRAVSSCLRHGKVCKHRCTAALRTRTWMLTTIH